MTPYATCDHCGTHLPAATIAEHACGDGGEGA